jgi:sugar phosphate isomerase/epimerase
MRLTRRSAIKSGAGVMPILAAPAAARAARAGSLGLVIHSFAVRTAGDRGRPPQDRFSDPARFLEYARSLGARGVQVGLGARDDPQAEALRARAEAASMYLEGIVTRPRDDADLGRFEAEVRTALKAGCEVVRTVVLTGRRYETFKSIAAFRRFAESSLHSLNLAAPVVARHGILLAVENHKDWRADELIAILKRVGNDHVGVCLDAGNSIALLEDPMEVVEALAPWSFTTHFKDMGLEEYRDGFLLAEVPLGRGALDLPRVVQCLRKARATIRFNIEMITRDPLLVPCLKEPFWVTFPELPGRHLARALSLVRDHPRSAPLPRISPLPIEERLRVEEENVRLSLAFARDQLGL